MLDPHAEALADWDSAVELSPLNRKAYMRASRAISRILACKVDEAVADVAELTKLKGWNANQLYNFGCI